MNAVSCLTNMLYYDIPTANSQEGIIQDGSVRKNILKSTHKFVFTQNPELQIETVRLMSNLSRHQDLSSEFGEKIIFDTLMVLLDHSIRDIVYFNIGIILNLTLNKNLR